MRLLFIGSLTIDSTDYCIIAPLIRRDISIISVFLFNHPYPVMNDEEQQRGLTSLFYDNNPLIAMTDSGNGLQDLGDDPVSNYSFLFISTRICSTFSLVS